MFNLKVTSPQMEQIEDHYDDLQSAMCRAFMVLENATRGVYCDSIGDNEQDVDAIIVSLCENPEHDPFFVGTINGTNIVIQKFESSISEALS